MMIRTCMLLLAAALAASAQGRYEVHAFAGYRFGGTLRFADADPSPVKLRGSVASGASFSYRFGEHGAIEAMWSRQSTAGATFAGTDRVALHHLLAAFVVGLRPPEKRLQPFVTAGMGASLLRGPNLPGTKLAATLGGGVKYYFATRLGIRLQVRYAPTEVYSTPGTQLVCNTYGHPGCYYPPKNHDMNQVEATLGWIVRI